MAGKYVFICKGCKQLTEHICPHSVQKKKKFCDSCLKKHDYKEKLKRKQKIKNHGQ